MNLASSDADMTGTYLNYLWLALGIIAILCLLLWFGWRRRKKRQSDVPAPEDVPAALLESEPAAAAEGMIIGTVAAGDYLDRISVHELGLRHHGRIELHTRSGSTPAGVAVFRAGVRNYFIPAAQLSSVRTDRGMVGKFIERDGVLMIGWSLGDIPVETGFRPRRADEGHDLLEALKKEVDTP